MNRIFRLVWNEMSGTWVAVAEFSRGRVKRSGSAARRASVLLAASTFAATASAGPPAPAASQLPTGGSVAAGAAVVRTPAGGAVMNVDQASQRAVINWSTFDVGSAAQVNFNQPNSSAVTLNRVLGSDASQIAGRITAPGQVFLSNPNGIVFGKTATVDVGGLAATTLGMADADFMAGRTVFTRNGTAGAVVNEGVLRAGLGGYVALLAPDVRNQGVVIAKLGTVALAAGDAVSLDFDADSRLAGITVKASALQALVRNQGAVLAPGGLIVLSAQALDRLQGGVVNNSGQLEADGLSARAGRIVLEASDRVEQGGSVHVDATTGTTHPAAGGPAGTIEIDARDIALAGATTATADRGQGGRIDVVASGSIDLANAVLDASGGAGGGSVRVQGGATPVDLAPGVDGPATVTSTGATRIVADSRLGAAGRIALTADTVRLLDQTTVDARGATAGGTVQVGGGYQGSGDLPQARRVEVAQGATIDASATRQGDGGTVSVWSDIHRADSGTIARGSLLATGGSQGGDGGRIETSGHWLDVSGAQVSASALHGAAGSWLLDPYSVTISTSAAVSNSGWAPTGSGSNMYVGDLNNALNNGTSIVATTGSSGSELGDINVNAAISKTAGSDATLTLRAANSIVLNSPVTSTSGKLNLVLDADNNNGSRDGAGVVILNSNIGTNGGSLAFGTGATLTLNGVVTKVGGDVYVGGSSAQSITTAGGAVTVNGEMILANTGGLTINSGNGNVTFAGLLNSGDSYVGVAGVSGSGSWDQAFTAAKGSTAGGAAVGDTYLATITSRLENAVASRAANYTGAWFGAHRDVNNGNGYTWRWVAGPEGLESGGAGRAFFQQTVGGGGGTAINSQYNNFGSGEPNGTGTTGEQVSQFFGTLAQWNDLTSTTNYGGTGQYAVTQYLRETNLPASPLTVIAGTGTVTFAGMVGGSKALASLNVNAGTIAINGGGVTTQGLQTYNGPMTLGSAATVLTQTNADTNFTLPANQSITNAFGGNASLTIATTGGIVLARGSSIRSTTGALATVLDADSDATGGGYIWLQGDGTTGATISSNGAAITLSGGATPSTGFASGSSTGNSDGVTLDTATLNSGGGNIVVRGQGATAMSGFTASEGVSTNSDGIRLFGSNTINAGSGTIALTGLARATDGSTANGIESNAQGYTKITSSATNTTAISLSGDASAGTAANGWGTFLWGGSNAGIVLAATGVNGGISVNGVGRGGVANGAGTQLEPNSFVLASSGPVSITGTRGSASTRADVVLDGTVGYVAALPPGFGTASPVTASTSNITLAADWLSANTVLGSGSFASSAVQGSGTLTILPRTPGKALTVQGANPGGTAAWVDTGSMFGTGGLVKPGFASVVFGSSSTGTVTLDNYSFDNDTQVATGGNAVLGTIGIASHTLVVGLTGSGSITDTGNVAVSRLALNGGTSTVTLDSAGNAIGTVAANVASLSLTNAGALTVGSAGGLNGITATGTVAVNTLAGDLTLAQDIASASTGAAAVLLNAGQAAAAGTAGGGNVVRSGTRSVTTGTGGRATLMTGSVAGSTGLPALAGLSSGRFRYGSDETTTAYAAALGSGIAVVYREQPLLTATATSASKVYDGVAYSGGNGDTLTGYLNGDTAAILGGTVGYGGSSQGATGAGSYALTLGGLTNTLGYGFAYVGGTLTVSPRPVSLTGTRTYDGTAGIAGSVLGIANLVGGDSVGITGGGTLADKSIGTRAIASVGTLALAGPSAANYTVAGATGSATVTAAPLTVNAPSSAAKTYDGTSNVQAAAVVGALAGAGAGEVVGTAPLVTYDSATAGTGKVVQSSGLHIVDSHGTDVTSNYAVTYVSATSGVVNQAPLTVTANADARFVSRPDDTSYNGASYTGLVGSETAGVLGGTLAVTRPNASNDVAAGTYAGALVPSGLTSSNYAITFANGNYTIVPANQLLIRVTNSSAAYGSAPGFAIASVAYLDANGATIVPLTGSVGGGANTFTYGDGAGGTVAFTLTPQGAVTSTAGRPVVGNYAVADANPTIGGGNFTSYTFVGNLAVTRAALTPTAGNVAKVYDGTTGMSGVTLGLNGAQANDLVSVTGTGAFSQKNAGTGLAYSVAGLALGGADADNYYLSGGSSLTGNNGVITPASLSISGVGALGKVYDATTAASLTGAAIINPVAGDVVALGGTGVGSFADKNVGAGKPVTVSGYTLGGADAGNYTLVQPTGLNASITPANLTVGGNLAAVSRTYDATTVAGLTGTPTVAGFGSDVIAIGGTGVGSFLGKDAQANKPVTVNGFVLVGADAGNYTLVQPTGLTATITPASLTVGGSLAAVDKTYDATTAATLVGTGTVTGLGADVVGLAGAGVAAFTDKNVGAGKAVIVGGYTLAGADAGNYTLVQPSGLTAAITPASLLVGGSLAAVGRTYDATTVATLTGAPTVTGLGNDVVAVGGTGVGAFADKNVGVGKAVTVSGYTLSGADAGNYVLVAPGGLSATIAPASLVVGGTLAAVDRTYDASAAVRLTGAPTVTAIGADVVGVSGTGVGTFADKNAGVNKAVTVSGYTLDGVDAGNYVLVQPAGLSATIAPAPLAVVGSLGAVDKTYDATTSAALTGTAMVNGLAGDIVGIGGTALAVFVDKNVGAGKAVSVSGYALTGADAGNYTLLAPAGLRASISPAPLQVGGNLVALGKTYDGTTTASLGGAPTVNAIAGDAVSIGGTGTGSFGDKNVGVDKSVTVAGYSLTGADAGNYTLVAPGNLVATITPARLTPGGNLAAADRIYDGTTVATLTGTPTVAAVAGDAVRIAGTGVGSFADKNVGVDKAVTVGGYTLEGADAANYILVQPAGLQADITPRPLAVAATVAAKVYDGSTRADVSLADDRVAGDALTLGYGTAAFADKNAGIGKTVDIGGIAATGADAANYSLTSSVTTTGDVARALLHVSATGTAKTYDATTRAAVTLGDDRVSGDALSVSYASATFADKNAGTGKAVDVEGISVTGVDAANYRVDPHATATADVAKATLTVGAVAQPRPFDGTTAATVTLSDNRFAGDQVVLAYASAGFADAAPGVGKPVSVTGVRITGGSDQGDYVLASNVASATADILPAAAPLPVATLPVANTAALPPVLAPVAPVPAPTAPRGGVDLTLPGTVTTVGAETVVPVAASTVPAGTVSSATTETPGAVWVALARQPAADQSGVVTVSVPRTMTTGTGFSFPLPTEVAQSSGAADARVTLVDGAPLPPWVAYSGSARTFSVTAAPAGGLPIELVVHIGRQEWTVTIVERADK